MLYFGQALRLVTAFDEDKVAAKADAQVDNRAVQLRLHLLVYLIVDDDRESLIVGKRCTIPPEVEQVGNGAQWASSDAHTVRDKLVMVRTLVAFCL